MSHGYLASEVAYRYTGLDTTGCRAGRASTDGAITVARPGYEVVPGTVEAIMAAVYRRGVAVVYWNVDESFVGYNSGEGARLRAPALRLPGHAEGCLCTETEANIAFAAGSSPVRGPWCSCLARLNLPHAAARQASTRPAPARLMASTTPW